MGNVKTSIFLILFASISVACVPAGLRAPGPSNEDGWANKEKATPERIRNEMLKCGEGRYLSNIEPLDGESIDNARARLQECLFAKGFYIKSGSGGYCSDSYYRKKLPACFNAPIRPHQGYYGE